MLAAAAALADVYPGSPVNMTSAGGIGGTAGDARWLRLDTTNDPLTGSLHITVPQNATTGVVATNATSGATAIEQFTLINDVATSRFGSLSFTNPTWSGSLPLRPLQLQLTVGSGADGGMAFVSNATATTSDMVFAVGQGSTIERLRFTMGAGQREAVFNEGSADLDFRIESDTDANAFFLDATNSRIGLGTSSPGTLALMDIRGGLRLGSTTLALMTSNVTNTGGVDEYFAMNAANGVGIDRLINLQAGGTTVAAVTALGNVLVGDGDASACFAATPSKQGLSFLSQTNMGITRCASNEMSFFVGTPSGAQAGFPALELVYGGAALPADTKVYGDITAGRNDGTQVIGSSAIPWASVTANALNGQLNPAGSKVLTGDTTNNTSTFATVATVTLPTSGLGSGFLTFHCAAALTAAQNVAADGIKARFLVGGTMDGQIIATQAVSGVTTTAVTASPIGTGMTSSFAGAGDATVQWDATLIIAVGGAVSIQTAMQAVTTGLITTYKGAYIECQPVSQ